MPPFIYMNNAATSWPKAPGVAEAVANTIREPVTEHGRSTLEGGDPDPVDTARNALAAHLGAEDPSHIILTSGATDSLNMLIHGFIAGIRPLSARLPHVITTALEHNSVLRPLYLLKANGRISLTVLPFHDGYISPGDVDRAIQPATVMLVMTHGSNVLGTVQDIHTIGGICADKGVFSIVDGAQTAGIAPPVLSHVPVDAYVFTGHKYLLGPAGTGGFWIRDTDALVPYRQGGTGTDSANPAMPPEPPERFEAGTMNYPGFAGLSEALAFLAAAGKETVHNRVRDTTRVILEGLSEIPGVIIHQSRPDLPVIPLSIRGIEPDDAGFLLQRAFGVITRTGLHCAPLVHNAVNSGKGCIRLSPSFFTTPTECDTTVRAIAEVTAHGS